MIEHTHESMEKRRRWVREWDEVIEVVRGGSGVIAAVAVNFNISDRIGYGSTVLAIS